MYSYNDQTLNVEEFNKIFIERKPYNEAGESIIDFSICGSNVFDEHTFKTIIIDTTQTIDNIQKILNSTREPLKLCFQPGVYFFNKSLILNRSSVILEGIDKKTIFKGEKGNNFNLIDIYGKKVIYSKTKIPILDFFIPIGTKKIKIDTNLVRQDVDIVIIYEMNKDWVTQLGMDKISESNGADSLDKNWDSETFVYKFERKIIDIDNINNTIELDYQISCTLDKKYGVFYIQHYNDQRISNIKIRNLVLESEFDETIFQIVCPIDSSEKEKEYFDENHPMTAINVKFAKNIIIDNVESYGFNEIINLDKSSKFCSILNCSYYKPSSIIEGEKRYSFNINGQFQLCKDCYAERGRHSFVSGSRNEGPIAFVNCKARITYAWSEPHHRYNLCGLYDNLDDNVSVENRLFFGSGHGWIGCYYIIWNPKKKVICQNTPLGTNFVVGGNDRENGNFFIKKRGYIFQSGKYINFNKKIPFESLYNSQIK